MISISPTADPEHQPKGNHPMTAQISPTALTVDGGVDLLLPRETPLEVLDAFVACEALPDDALNLRVLSVWLDGASTI